MRKMVGGFDPSPEPLRPMGRAHRGVLKRDGFVSQEAGDAVVNTIKPSPIAAN